MKIPPNAESPGWLWSDIWEKEGPDWPWGNIGGGCLGGNIWEEKVDQKATIKEE